MLARAEQRRRQLLWRGVGTAALGRIGGYLVLGLSGVAVLRKFDLLLAASVARSHLAAHAVLWILPPAPRQPNPTRKTHIDTTEMAV